MDTFSWQDKNEEGQKVTYRASYFGGWWQLEVAPKLGRAQRDEVEFEPAEFNEDIWKSLRTMLWNKYRRRRVSWELVDHIDQILAGKKQNERRDRR